MHSNRDNVRLTRLPFKFDTFLKESKAIVRRTAALSNSIAHFAERLDDRRCVDMEWMECASQ